MDAKKDRRAGGELSPPAQTGLTGSGWVTSPWGWRILAFFTLVALGLCITFFSDGHAAYGAAWAVIALAWGTFTVILWRHHLARA